MYVTGSIEPGVPTTPFFTMLRTALTFAALAGASAFSIAPLAKHAGPVRAAAVMNENRRPDSRSASRERLLPDLLKALDDVSSFIAKADASRQRKAEAPSAECIETYVAMLESKIELLSAEAKVLREAEAKGGEVGETKVRWTDIDGNLHNDAVWLKKKTVGF